MIIITENHSLIDLGILKCVVVRLLIYSTTWITSLFVFFINTLRKQNKKKIKKHTHTHLTCRRLITTLWKYLKTYYVEEKKACLLWSYKEQIKMIGEN